MATIVVSLVPSLALSAPKRAAEPTLRKFFLHMTAEGSGDVGEGSFPTSLSIEDYLDESASASVFEGLPNEAFILTGAREPVITEFPTVDGTPLRLDASRAVTGTIALKAYRIFIDDMGVPLGGGALTVELRVDGQLRSGREVPVGTQKIEAVVTPAQELYLLDVDIPIPDDLDRKVLSSLTLTMLFRGPSAMAASLELDDPASFIEAPIFEKAA